MAESYLWRLSTTVSAHSVAHPEANPYPNDSLDFFDDVLALAED